MSLDLVRKITKFNKGSSEVWRRTRKPHKKVSVMLLIGSGWSDIEYFVVLLF